MVFQVSSASQSYGRTLEGTCSRRMIWMTSASKERGRFSCTLPDCLDGDRREPTRARA